jgi:hypothetical protein
VKAALRRIAALPGVPLSELERRAALQVRQDRKYIVGRRGFDRLVAALKDSHGALDIGGERVFAYDTMYFDTGTMLCYRAHVQDRRRRFKARSRLYVDSGRCVFEVKLKGRCGETVKHALVQPADHHGVLTPQARAFLAEHVRAFAPEAAGWVEPRLSTHYRRITLVSIERPERLTCDVDLRFSAAGGPHGRLSDGCVLIETKSAGGHSAADAALRGLGARPLDGLSKYCVGVVLSGIELPTNPFRHVVRRHFRVARGATSMRG